MKGISSNQVIKSTCAICQIGCGILIRVKAGKVIEVEGNPECPLCKGILCPKGLASLEYLYHPDRLKQPLKRVGKRGEGKWQQVSWDEALDLVAAQLKEAKDKYGTESVAFVCGAPKGLQSEYVRRFANVFGSPNVAAAQHVCFLPRDLASRFTYGTYVKPDYENQPACIVVWGKNLSANLHHAYNKAARAIDNGSKLIVIDPRKTDLASRADLWLQIRPGSDLALALAMINVIVNENLYDTDFVRDWTVGFDKLEAHVQDYSPEKVSEITWVPAETIRNAARLYATSKPACIQWGNSLDMSINNVQNARAICILRAITGNLGVPGGEAQWILPMALLESIAELRLEGKVPDQQRNRKLDAALKLLPGVKTRVTPQSVIKAILEEEPYPIRVLYVAGTDPLLSYSNAQETYKALNKVDFLVVVEMFMSPTAALADIVLPVTTFFETNGIVSPPYSDAAIAVHQKVIRIDDCRSDYEILRDLAKRLGMENYFWEDDSSCVDALFHRAGVTFDEFKKTGPMSGLRLYRNYQTNGFATASGKVELYSNYLEELGFEPLPIYHEPPETPYSDPKLFEEYPLTFISSKIATYRHSEGRQIPSLRGVHPEPIVSIHPETAAKLGIREGDWAYIETKRGRIKQKAKITQDLDPRVVEVDYGWWFPEKGVSSLYGWSEANVNVLTDNKPPYSPETGATTLRGILCKVYKA